MLTGNDLGLLGNVERIPDKKEVQELLENSKISPY